MLTVFKKVGSGLAAFGKGFAGFANKVKAVWNLISEISPTIAHDALVIFADITAAVADAEAAATQGLVNFELDSKVYDDIKQLIVDAKNGEHDAVNIIKHLELTAHIAKPQARANLLAAGIEVTVDLPKE